MKPSIRIPEVHDFNATRASRELLKQGFTAVDDIGELLYKHAEEDLLDALGFQADFIELVTDRIDTDFGPVFVFRDSSRVALDAIAPEIQKARRVE